MIGFFLSICQLSKIWSVRQCASHFTLKRKVYEKADHFCLRNERSKFLHRYNTRNLLQILTRRIPSDFILDCSIRFSHVRLFVERVPFFFSLSLDPSHNVTFKRWLHFGCYSNEAEKINYSSWNGGRKRTRMHVTKWHRQVLFSFVLREEKR